MPDIRKVRPVAPLDAERREAVGWNEAEGEFARSFIRCPGYDHDAAYSDAEFAAHFMPAELFDAVLTAAREIAAHWLEGKGEYVYPTRGDIDALVQAVRAYDAARTGEGL